jgi:hypothetical protein
MHYPEFSLFSYQFTNVPYRSEQRKCMRPSQPAVRPRHRPDPSTNPKAPATRPAKTSHPNYKTARSASHDPILTPDPRCIAPIANLSKPFKSSTHQNNAKQNLVPSPCLFEVLRVLRGKILPFIPAGIRIDPYDIGMPAGILLISRTAVPANPARIPVVPSGRWYYKPNPTKSRSTTTTGRQNPLRIYTGCRTNPPQVVTKSLATGRGIGEGPPTRVPIYKNPIISSSAASPSAVFTDGS